MKVLIVYEVRVREIDSALLLKTALEMRGYEVKIVDKNSMFRMKYRDCIIVVPNSYHTLDYQTYNYTLNAKNNHIINLQYEQVYSKSTEEKGYMIPKGKAKKEHFICWGPYTYNKLTRIGLKSSQLSVTGALQLDFLRPEFSSFWRSKEEISHQYNIPLDKEWLLYISSFSYVNNTRYIKNAINEIGAGDHKSIKEMERVSNESHKITLEWFEKLIEENENFIMIYRPHPMEASHPQLKKIQEKFPENFYVISDLNVKQWITISDQVFTWISTSITESFFAKKMCHILRPIPIPEDLDPRIYEGTTNIIDTYQGLVNIVKRYNSTNNFIEEEFPINKDNINRYYLWDDEASYEKIINVIETIEVTEKQPIEKKYFLNRWKFLYKNNILRRFLFIKLYQFLHKNFDFKIKNESFRKRYSVNKLEKQAKRQNKKELQEKEIKIKKILEKY